MVVADPPKALHQHRIDDKGAILCSGCDKRLGFRIGFLSPEHSADVVIYRLCKYCNVYNMIFLNRLIPSGKAQI